VNAIYPVDKQVDVFVNRPLSYKFDKAVDETSLYSGSVILYDVKDNHVVDGALSYDEVNFIVSFLPVHALTPNTSYTWNFAGAEDPDLYPLKFTDNTPLTKSIFIDFQTGLNVYTTPVEVNQLETTSIIQDGQTLTERENDTFKIVSSYPEHLQSGIDVTTKEVVVTFSAPIKTGQDLASLVKLSYSSLLRDTYLFNSGRFNTTTAKEPGKAAKTSVFDLPSYTLEAVDNTLTITFDADKNLNANAFVSITISKNMLSATNEQLNGTQDETFYFLTELFPMLTNVPSVLLALNEIEGLVSEEVVLKYILSNSFKIWNISGKAFSLTDPPPAAIRFVECATIVDLIDSKAISKELNKGKSVQLAELKISYEFPRSPDSEVISVRSHASRCMEDAKRETSALHGKGEFLVGERGVNTTLVNDIYRNRIQYKSGISRDPGNF